MVHACDAVCATETACANRGLNVNLDLDGSEHYGGMASQNPDGSYYLSSLQGDGYCGHPTAARRATR